MQSFDSFGLLSFKLFVLVGTTAIVGATVQVLLQHWRCPKQQLWTSPADKFLCLPLGLLTVLLIGYGGLRLAVVLGLPNPYVQSLRCIAVGIAGLLLAAGYVARHQLQRWDWQKRFLTRTLPILGLALGISVVGSWLAWLPLLQDSDLVYFSGIGTDALGYIRVTQSIVEGWYFQPRPQFNLDYLLYKPEGGWVYEVIRSKERPGIYYLIALVTSLTHTNPFQGYLICGPLALTLLSQYLFFLAYALTNPRWVKAVLTILVLAVLPLTGLAGNFYHQFLGHVWAITALVILGPMAGLFAVRNGRQVALPIAAFVFCLITNALYDIRYAMIGVVILSISFAVCTTALGRSPSWIGFCILGALMAAALAIECNGNAQQDFSNLFSTRNNFPDNLFSLQEFLYNAALGLSDQESVHRFKILAGVTTVTGLLTLPTVGRALWFYSRKGQTVYQHDGIGLLFVRLFNFLLLLISVPAVVLLLKNNQWAAMKNMFLLVAALSVELLLLAVGIRLISTSRRHKALLLSFAAILLYTSVPAINAHSATAQQIHNTNLSGVVRRHTLLNVTETLRSLPPGVVWYEGNILNFLVFTTLMHDSGWGILAPYDNLWISGLAGYPFGSFYPKNNLPQDPRAAYDTLLALPKVKDAERMAIVFDGAIPSLAPEGFQVFSDVTFGFLPARKILQRDFLGKLTFQKLQLQVKFPSLKTGVEPLVATGIVNASDTIYVRYLPNHQIAIGLDHLGARSAESQPLSIQPNQFHDLVVTLDRASAMVTVKMNAQTVLQSPGSLYPTYRSTLIGEGKSENRLQGGAILPGSKFSGMIQVQSESNSLLK